MKTIIRYEETFDGVGVYIMAQDKNGRVIAAEPLKLEFSEVKEYPMLPEPTLRFVSNQDGNEFLQDMANELARLGFLPKIAEQSRAELDATKNHLEDMRALVFKRRRD